jgi:hypothetical protein
MFNAPNIKGPRFRKDYKKVLNRSLYDKFIVAHPEHSNISFEKFESTVSSSLNKMWQVTLDERDGIQLPIGGSLFIGSTKIRVKNNYDIQASIKANLPIKHRNHDTDGYVAKIYYSPYLAKVSGRDRSLWSFKGVREYKRKVSTVYPVNYKKYIVVAELYTVVREYQKHRARNYFTESTERAAQTYNEFDLN